jgi:hypothetical protein
MDFQKPISEQLPEIKMPDTQAIQNSISSSLGNLSNTVSNLQGNLNSSLDEFSSKSVVGASQEFLNSNSIIAKFVFIILVLIGFMFLTNLGIMLIGYFSQPSTSPYLINGMVDGNQGIIIPQDPTNANSISIFRSNNQSTGIEFTWSIWLLITGSNQNTTTKYSHIFNKGDANYDSATGIAKVNNAPGLYLIKDTAKTSENCLRVIMDQVTNTPAIVDISGVPMNKWFHLAMRMENTVLDTYINGIIFGRIILQAVPKQNYFDVNIAQNGGFQGKISNLRYYSYALSAFDIGNIVNTGPKTSTSSLALSTANTAANYLSSQWYTQ